MTDKFQPGQKVRCLYRDAGGDSRMLNGEIVGWEDEHQGWRVKTGLAAFIFKEEHIHGQEADKEASEGGEDNARVQGGEASLGKQDGSEGQES